MKTLTIEFTEEVLASVSQEEMMGRAANAVARYYKDYTDMPEKVHLYCGVGVAAPL